MNPKTGCRKIIRVGVVGASRGQSFAADATDLVGMKLVALCHTYTANSRAGTSDWGNGGDRCG